MKFWIYAVIMLFCCIGCEKADSSSVRSYRVARDPTWYPLNFMGKGDNVLAFSDELLNQMAYIEGFNVDILQDGWDNIIFDLSKGHYDAILTSLEPTEQYRARYSFSDVYLHVGDVIVVRADSPVLTLQDLEGKILAVKNQSLSLLTLEEFPDVVTEKYHNTANVLESLEAGVYDGVVMGILPAYAFTENIYKGRLRVCDMMLTKTGLRLMTLKGKNKELIQSFNTGLNSIKKSGGYDSLLRKWDLNQ